MYLDETHRNKIRDIATQYKDELENELNPKGTWYPERHKREQLFKRLLSKQNLKKLREKELATIIKQLWATQIWGNKDYFFNKLVKDNGFDNIKEMLYNLLYGDNPLDIRFDNFRNKIKRLGDSSITEILMFVFPKKYCLWNNKPKIVLSKIGVGDLLPSRVFKYRITGKEYVQINNLLNEIRTELEKVLNRKIDFIDLDIFFWILFNRLPKSKGQKKVEELESPAKSVTLNELKNPHTDIEGILLELGRMLGYETYTPDKSKVTSSGKKLASLSTLQAITEGGYIPREKLSTVKRIDVIWFDKNLLPKHCFEVENTTGVTNGLHRLYQIRLLKPTFFIVAPRSVQNKFKSEVQKDPYNTIRDRYLFKSYSELLALYNIVKKYKQAKDKFFMDII